MKKNKSKEKKEVYAIATKYKRNPISIEFYTQEGKSVPKEKVEKEKTEEGFRLFTFAT